ncbi:hypothetical protein [Nonomuraea sediminis]|uniref:hypothetical protein n=1 Tax=Nonomuraea sediminis TaxID=2835864 RepID=UPI002029DA99|nr:hypothetical protein [Nonomuraea sediminis]
MTTKTSAIEVAGLRKPYGDHDGDTMAFDTVPPARRLIELLKQRGWTGWTKLERVAVPPDEAPR